MARAGGGAPLRNILVTGQPGVGKSTLIASVIEAIKQEFLPMAGFFTEEVCKGGSRVGFDVVALDGRRAPLSRVSAKKGGGPRVGKYAVDLEGFEALALPLLRERADAKLVVIDEVGKMELFSDAFKELVRECVEDPETVVLVPMPRYGHTIPFVEELKARGDSRVVKLLKGTRDEERGRVRQLVRDVLGGGDGGEGGEGEALPAVKRRRK